MNVFLNICLCTREHTWLLFTARMKTNLFTTPIKLRLETATFGSEELRREIPTPGLMDPPGTIRTGLLGIQVVELRSVRKYLL